MATRKQYIEKLAARLQDMDKRIDELRESAEKAGAGMKENIGGRLAELKDKRARAAHLLDELHEAGDDAWKSVKARVDKLYEDLREVFRKAA